MYMREVTISIRFFVVQPSFTNIRGLNEMNYSLYLKNHKKIYLFDINLDTSIQYYSCSICFVNIRDSIGLSDETLSHGPVF